MTEQERDAGLQDENDALRLLAHAAQQGIDKNIGQHGGRAGDQQQAAAKGQEFLFHVGGLVGRDQLIHPGHFAGDFDDAGHQRAALGHERDAKPAALRHAEGKDAVLAAGIDAGGMRHEGGEGVAHILTVEHRVADAFHAIRRALEGRGPRGEQHFGEVGALRQIIENAGSVIHIKQIAQGETFGNQNDAICCLTGMPGWC